MYEIYEMKGMVCSVWIDVI